MAIGAAPSDGPVLVGKGATVILGGSEVPVVFDLPALVEIEERWGSLNAFAAELQKGSDGKMFKCVASAISATVRGLPTDPVKLMDPNRIVEYAEAIGNAFMEAIPMTKGPVPEPGQEIIDGPLTGAASTTPASSDSGWRPPTSGE